MNVNRTAYTLVEVLVVIAIIGILLSLTLSSLGPATARVRQTQCANNLREIARGALLFESSKRQFPGFLQKYGDFSGGVDPIDPANFGGAVPAHEKVAAFGVAILPYLGRQPQYEIWTDDRYPIISDAANSTVGNAGTNFGPVATGRIPTFLCASDVSSTTGPGANSYITNNGMAHASGATVDQFTAAQSKNNGVFNAKFTSEIAGPRISLSDLKDGLSSTALFSENAQALPWYRPGFLNGADMSSITYGDALASARYTSGMVWHPEDSLLGPAVSPIHEINGGSRRSLNSVSMQPTNARDLARPSSMHLGGVNMAFADGATRFVVETIDYRVYQAILTPRGASSDVPAPSFILTDELEN